MYSSHGVVQTPDALPPSSMRDVCFDDLLAHRGVYRPKTRRTSKGACGQQRVGTAIRISKPNSTSNSPGSSSSLGARRRTMVSGDGLAPRRQQIGLDYFSAPQNRTARPLSWHPSSCFQATQPVPLQALYGLQSMHNNAAEFQDYFHGSQPQFSPPTVSTYSNDTSPSSTFSPLPYFSGPEQSHFAQAEDWSDDQQLSVHMCPSGEMASVGTPFSTSHELSAFKAATNFSMNDWNAYMMQDCESITPPTPEVFAQPQQAITISEAAITISEAAMKMSEAALPYASLDESEEEGEILVGMGLYDNPDKIHEDPQLDNYRATVSSLLGSPYRSQEPKGKGLKLEETWEPPNNESDDGEEEDDAEDEE